MTFLDEIRQQPRALYDLFRFFKSNPESIQKLRSLLTKASINQIIFTGMGSSLFASYVPCHFLRQRGFRALAMESNELLHYADVMLDESSLVILVSQSGKSPEPLLLAKKLKEKNILTVSVTNEINSELSLLGNIHLELTAGTELHTTSKTYTNSIALLMILAYILTNDSDNSLNSLYKMLIAAADHMKKILNDTQRVHHIADFFQNSHFFAHIGSGASYATASQGELIMVEAAHVYSSRYTTGQFIHGPLENVDENFAAIIHDFDPAFRTSVDNIIRDISNYDGKALLLTNRKMLPKIKNVSTFPIHFENPNLSPILEIMPIELMVHEIGIRKNIQPGVLQRTAK